MKLFKLQQEIGKISKSQTNPFFKSRYFDINALLEQLQPLLEKHQLLILQPLSSIGERPAIETIILDAETGDQLTRSITPLPDLTDPQKQGSAITYYRRYSLQSLLGLQAEDDDGNKASGSSIPKMEAGLNKAREVSIENKKKDIKVFLENNMPIKPKTKEDYENACLEITGIELKEDNYDNIINIINNQ